MARKERPSGYYTPDYFRSMPPKDLRKWYSKNRSIAQKRIQRLLSSEFAELQEVQNYRAGFPTLVSIDSERALVYESVKLARFINWGGSTVRGQRTIAEAVYESAKKAGMGAWEAIKDAANKIREAVTFRMFMEEAKDKGIYQVYGSEVLLDAYDRASSMGIDPRSLLRGDNPLEDFAINYRVLKIKEFQVDKLKVKSARNIARRMDKVDSDVDYIKSRSVSQLKLMVDKQKWKPYEFLIEDLIKARS